MWTKETKSGRLELASSEETEQTDIWQSSEATDGDTFHLPKSKGYG